MLILDCEKPLYINIIELVTQHVAKQLPRRFEIPRSERRANGDASVSGFGVNDWQKLKNIMDKTGCQIEVLATQDQTLAFLITGSDESFGNAKDELSAQFQTRTQDVSIPSVVPTPTTVQDAVCYYYSQHWVLKPWIKRPRWV